jgi:hypothetical protein
VNPTIQPQYISKEIPSYAPPPDMIHPSVLHHNRPQHVDLTTQVERENLGRRREEYFNNLFQNPNQSESNNILSPVYDSIKPKKENDNKDKKNINYAV